jgi:hypothetical protein
MCLACFDAARNPPDEIADDKVYYVCNILEEEIIPSGRTPILQFPGPSELQ